MVPAAVSLVSSSWSWTLSSGVSLCILVILAVTDTRTVEVLKSNRPPMDKLLWCVLVFIFPFIGVLIYWLFSNRKAHNTYEPIS